MSALLRSLLCGLALSLPMGQGVAAPAAGGAPAVLLAAEFRPGIDPAAYLVSEKLDGVRAYWDGKQLLSRSGRVIDAPDWFVAALPATPLDGELWLGRGRFEQLAATVQRGREAPGWQEVRYMLFELPAGGGSFAERSAALRELAAQIDRSWIEAILQFSTVDRESLEKRLAEVLSGGGEGLMLHRADAPYQTGRSDLLLKMKPWQDGEAEVIAHLPGKGKYAGQLGALRVRTADGREFKLGSGLSDAERRAPPPLGSIVTYRFRELTARGLPRFASFLRLRLD